MVTDIPDRPKRLLFNFLLNHMVIGSFRQVMEGIPDHIETWGSNPSVSARAGKRPIK